jgi:hypothetical protein
MVRNVINTYKTDFGFHVFIFRKYPIDQGIGHEYLCSVPNSLQENINVVLYVKYNVIPSFDLCPDPLPNIFYYVIIIIIIIMSLQVPLMHIDML